MIIFPLILDWMFSSVTPARGSSKVSFKSVLNFSTVSSISITLNSISRFSARLFASSTELSGLYFEGIAIPITLSDPRASTAIVAVRAESIPPDSPTRTL